MKQKSRWMRWKKSQRKKNPRKFAYNAEFNGTNRKFLCMQTVIDEFTKEIMQYVYQYDY